MVNCLCLSDASDGRGGGAHSHVPACTRACSWLSQTKGQNGLEIKRRRRCDVTRWSNTTGASHTISFQPRPMMGNDLLPLQVSYVLVDYIISNKQRPNRLISAHQFLNPPLLLYLPSPTFRHSCPVNKDVLIIFRELAANPD